MRRLTIQLPLLCFLLARTAGFAQENETRGTIRVERSTCVTLADSDTVYSSVDKMPEFKGGDKEMLKWIRENLKGAPLSPEEQGGCITVFCSFVVSSSGKVEEIVVRKGTSPYYEKEMARLLAIMPGWHPGKCNGEKVPVKLNYPFRFTLK
jgi:protein TonB